MPAAICLLTVVLGSCAPVSEGVAGDHTVQPNASVVDTAYTGGKLDMVTKNGFYESFDDVEAGTEYASEDGERTYALGRLSLVTKRTTFYIEKSDDGNAIRYHRSGNSVGIDPYIDVDIEGGISSSRYICQADFKMASDYNMGGGILQVIYRASGKPGVFWSTMSLDAQGNILVGGTKIGALNKNTFTNLAVAVDIGNLSYKIYIDGKEAGTYSMAPNDITGYYFADVRVIQTSGSHSGSLYVDNIAVYEGKYPASMIPSDDTEIAVSEDLETQNVGAYNGSVISTDSRTYLEVRQSADDNKFLSARLNYADSTLSFPRGGIGNDEFVFSADIYRNDASPAVTLKAGYRELVTVEKNGEILVDDNTVFYVGTDEWLSISAAVRADGFSVFVNGILCAEVNDTLSELNGAYLILNGNAGDYVFIDDIRIYRAYLPIEYSGTMPEKTYTLYSYDNYEIMLGECNVSPVTVDGIPLVKVNNIGLGKPMEVKFADAGFDENPGDYNAVRMTFYCPQAYNYALLCLLDCGQQEGGWSYYSEYFCLEEKGWVTITLEFNDMAPSRTPSYEYINSVAFNNEGWAFTDKGGIYNSESWGNASERELEFYIYRIELVKY